MQSNGAQSNSKFAKVPHGAAETMPRRATHHEEHDVCDVEDDDDDEGEVEVPRVAGYRAHERDQPARDIGGHHQDVTCAEHW